MTDEKQGYCRFCGQAIYDATAATQTKERRNTATAQKPRGIGQS